MPAAGVEREGASFSAKTPTKHVEAAIRVISGRGFDSLRLHSAVKLTGHHNDTTGHAKAWPVVFLRAASVAGMERRIYLPRCGGGVP